MIGTTFLAELAAGCLLMTAACRTDHVAGRYFRLMALAALGLLATSVIGALVSGFELRDAAVSMRLSVLVAFAVLVLWLALNARHGDRPHSSQRICALISSSCILFVARSLAMQSTALAQTDEFIRASWVAILLGSAVLGGTGAAMLLGHAYLTQTSMPIDPLRRLTRLLALGVALSLLWTGAVLWQHRAILQEPPANAMWLWLMLSVRVGVGLLGLGVLTYMVNDCVARRSTQSATGILYITMIFAFFGALSALELARTFSLWV